MKNKKKELPLDILEAFSVFKGIDFDVFEISTPDNSIIKIQEKGHPDFYFLVKNFENKSVSFAGGSQLKKYLMLELAPENSEYVKPKACGTYLDRLEKLFLEWVSNVEKYNSIETVFDDPIAKAYEEEFYQEWKIADEGADTKPFPTDKIILLDTFLEETQNRLLLPQYNTLENANVINEISSDIQSVRENLAAKSQNAIIRQMGKAFSKIAKLGVPYIKEFFKVARNESYKMIFKGLVEVAKNLGDGDIL